MDVQNVPIGEVIPYEKNPRKNDKAVDVVAKSIKEFGFQQPIVVDKNNVVVVGHTRLLAAQKLGLTEVPITWADELSEDQVKAYRIMDNKSSMFAEWDFDLLKEEFHALEGTEAFDFTGFTGDEISKIWDIQAKEDNAEEIMANQTDDSLDCHRYYMVTKDDARNFYFIDNDRNREKPEALKTFADNKEELLRRSKIEFNMPGIDIDDAAAYLDNLG